MLMSIIAVAAVVIALAVNSEVVGMIALTVVVFIGMAFVAIAVLKEIDRMEAERRKAEW